MSKLSITLIILLLILALAAAVARADICVFADGTGAYNVNAIPGPLPIIENQPIGTFSGAASVVATPKYARLEKEARIKMQIIDTYGLPVGGASIAIAFKIPDIDPQTGITKMEDGDMLLVAAPTGSIEVVDGSIPDTDNNGFTTAKVKAYLPNEYFLEVTATGTAGTYTAMGRLQVIPEVLNIETAPGGKIKFIVTDLAGQTDFLVPETEEKLKTWSACEISSKEKPAEGEIEHDDPSFYSAEKSIVSSFKPILKLVAEPEDDGAGFIAPVFTIDDGIDLTHDERKIETADFISGQYDYKPGYDTEIVDNKLIHLYRFQNDTALSPGLNRIRINFATGNPIYDMPKTLYILAYEEDESIGDQTTPQNDHDDNVFSELNPFEVDIVIERLIEDGNNVIQTENYQSILPGRIAILFNESTSDATASQILRNKRAIPLSVNTILDRPRIIEVYSLEINNPFELEKIFDGVSGVRGASAVHAMFYYGTNFTDPFVTEAIETDFWSFLKDDGGPLGSEHPTTVIEEFPEDAVFIDIFIPPQLSKAQ
ncbi:hypothetical protein ACFL54_09370, partial [Planctomycetota bacterium]